MNSKFLKCECSTHALEVNYDSEEQQYNFSIWHYGHYGDTPMSFREKLRWCWRILKTGNPWADAVILSETTKRELVDYLISTQK